MGWIMDYGIGMFLAGLVSGAGIGWYVALLKMHSDCGNPEDLMRERMLHKGLCRRQACLWMVTRGDNLT